MPHDGWTIAGRHEPRVGATALPPRRPERRHQVPPHDRSGGHFLSHQWDARTAVDRGHALPVDMRDSTGHPVSVSASAVVVQCSRGRHG